MPELAEAPTGARTILPSEDFPAKFNRESFLFRHRLAEHPLFTLPRLIQLAMQTRKDHPQDLYYDTGKDVAISTRWDAMGAPPPLEEALERIENNGAWITIHQAQNDPEYAAIYDQCMKEFSSLSGVDFNKVMRVKDALIFITSPNRVTTYHIDRECNFLLQIHGGKMIYVFDSRDHEVLPEDEIERFWTVDNNAPTYKPQFQERSRPYHLEPGNGVHLPVNWPHWLKNDNNISVSLSVNFTWKDSERGNVYRANHYLRKYLKVNPRPPFESPLSDGMKNALMAMTYNPARAANRLVHQLKGDPVRLR